MQLEELQRQWQRLDEKLEQTLKLDSELLRQTVMPPTRRRVNRLAIWPALDIAFCLVVLLLAGSFLGDHWLAWSIVGPATVVIVATTILLIDSIRQLVRVAEVDWCGTVVDIQSSLSRLRITKIRQFKWIILLSPLVGFSGLIVGLQWLLDRLPEPHFILEKVDPWWVVANYAFGVLFLPFGYAAIRFVAKRLRTRGWFQRVLDDISGTSIKRVELELERWASFDRAGSNEAI